MAKDVRIVDNTLPQKYFAFLNGTNTLQFAQIRPNAVEERTLLFKPKAGFHGRFNFAAADVQYASDGQTDLQTGVTAEPGYLQILSTQEFDRRFSLHLVSSVGGGADS